MAERRRHERRPARGVQALNLTPMIDVTFQLLIYFLLAASFALGEEIYRLDLPDRDRRNRPASGSALEEPVFVRVRSVGAGEADLEISLDGPFPAPSGASSLEEILLGALIGPSNPGGTLSRSQPIVIVASADTRWEHAVAVFDAAVRCGFTRVAFAPAHGAIEDLP